MVFYKFIIRKKLYLIDLRGGFKFISKYMIMGLWKWVYLEMLFY